MRRVTWGLLLRPTVLLGIALGLASIGLYVQRQQLTAARADRDMAELRANTLAGDLKVSQRANAAQALTITALQAAANEWARVATDAQAASQAAEKRAAARQRDTDRTLAAMTARFAEYTRKPVCAALMAQDVGAVCEP